MNHAEKGRIRYTDYALEYFNEGENVWSKSSAALRQCLAGRELTFLTVPAVYHCRITDRLFEKSTTCTADFYSNHPLQEPDE